MIKGITTNQRDKIMRREMNYRELSALNCSMIKLFDTDPIKFFEEFKLSKKRKDKKNTSLIIGDIVDFYILDCRGNDETFETRFEEKFALFQGIKTTGQVFKLCDILYDVAQEYTEDGVITVSFDTLFTEAFEKAKEEGLYKGKTKDKVLEDFNSNGLTYYKMLISNTGKTVVDVSLINKSKKVAKSVINDPFHASIFHEDAHTEYISKFPIQWKYKIGEQEIDCKSEVDIFTIDHNNKLIHLKDLKTNYDNENFEYSYLKYRYDLQAAFYYLALEYWKNENDMQDYKIVPMEFIVADTSSNNRRAIRYKTTEQDLEIGLNGGMLNDKYHKGIHELIKEICWADENGIWDVSKEVFDNQGVMKLKLKYN